MTKLVAVFTFAFYTLLPSISFSAKELPLFASDDVLDITIRADIKNLIDTIKVRTPNLRPAVLSYSNSSGNMISQNVTVDVRGNSKRSFCRFPPLRLVFDTRNRENGVFHGIKEVKIATHCDPKLTDHDTIGSNSEANVIQEYMIYKLYNLYTNASLKVRLVRIHYEDINNSIQPTTNMAFFLEDSGDAARRLDWQYEKAVPHAYVDFEPYSFARTLMFSMMIGHGDWRIHENGQLYNSKSYKDTNGNLHIILYDFDLSLMMGDGHLFVPARPIGPGLMYWKPEATASMFNRTEKEFAELKHETTKIRDRLVCLGDEDINALMIFVNQFQSRAGSLFENPIFPTPQREYSKRVFNDFFDLLNQNKLDLRILKSACP